MKDVIKNITIILIGGAVLIGVMFYWSNLRGVGPAINGTVGDIAQDIQNHNSEPVNDTQFPLTLPESFRIEVYASNLSGARVIAFDANNNMWVSQTSEGVISKLTPAGDGSVNVETIFRGLRKPHGIAFDVDDPNMIYIAEEHRVSRTRLDSDGPLQTIAELPTAGGGHFTRTIGFGPDERLYVSIGSSCNVCDEQDDRRAAIYVMDKDGSNFESFATGLRNAVFFDWSYVDGRMWATEMGRDLLGDDVPPDEINVIREGDFYGWPICYGNNTHDTNFDKNTYIRNPCMEPFEIPAKVDLQAHSAPLGLAFVPEEGWPQDMWHDLIVAFHGSWNRSIPTGYKLVRIKLDEQGNYQGTEDFISGWLAPGGALGRPVDVYIRPGGEMFVSDDKAGLIYRITYQGN